MRDWEVPGLALVVMRGGEVPRLVGYGTRRLGEDSKVDGGTYLQIASNTETFTAYAIGILVPERPRGNALSARSSLMSRLRCDMSRRMRTTVRLDDSLLQRAKDEAARRGVTLTSLIERGLRLVLARPEKRAPRRRVDLPVCREVGGTLPGIDLDDSATLLDIAEGRR